jgi:hypothetical protein
VRPGGVLLVGDLCRTSPPLSAVSVAVLPSAFGTPATLTGLLCFFLLIDVICPE